MQDTFLQQEQRLKEAGFPTHIINGVSEKLLKTVNVKQTEPADKKGREKCAGLPYVHSLLHSIKKVANRQGVEVVFLAPRKLSSSCRCIGKIKNWQCTVNHEFSTFPVQCKSFIVCIYLAEKYKWAKRGGA